MAPESSGEQDALGKGGTDWRNVLVACVLTFLLGGGGGSLLTTAATTKADASADQLARESEIKRREEEAAEKAVIREQLAQLSQKFDQLQTAVLERTRDRWSRGDDEAAMRALRERLDLDRQRHDQRVGDLERRVKELTEELRAHTVLPWHREAGAEHQETKRRLDRLETSEKQGEKR